MLLPWATLVASYQLASPASVHAAQRPVAPPAMVATPDVAYMYATNKAFAQTSFGGRGAVGSQLHVATGGGARLRARGVATSGGEKREKAPSSTCRQV